MKNCEDCKWWSELCAASFGCEEIKALCLNPDSSEYNKMTRSGCDKKENGTAVDNPCFKSN